MPKTMCVLIRAVVTRIAKAGYAETMAVEAVVGLVLMAGIVKTVSVCVIL